MLYHWASTTELEMSKDYNEIIVEENEVADYAIFIEIPEKYGALKQIDEKFVPDKTAISYEVLIASDTLDKSGTPKTV